MTWRSAIRRRLGVIAAIVAVAAGCARASTPGDSGPLDGRNTTGGLVDTGLAATCGAARFDHLPPDTSILDPFTAWAELDRSGLRGEGPFFDDFIDRYAWFVTERSGGSLVLFGEPRRSTEQEVPYAYASLTPRAGALVPAGWGECAIELTAEGWGNARFVLDPSVRPNPTSTTLSVLATEVACASGEPPRGRDVRAVVLEETRTTVSVAILVEPRGGNCQSNPSFPFEIDLASPLGDRTVLDASVYPPKERVWSPA